MEQEKRSRIVVPEHMHEGCLSICPNDAQAMHVRTQRTNATYARIQDLRDTSRLSTRENPVDNSEMVR